jgi:6,7-dimethyl-8-ribityllumazine synthase
MSDSGFNFQAVTADPAWKIGIVKSKWNHEIVNMLASEVINHLEASGIKLIEIFEVPGSWELIPGAQKLISKCDLIIPLGVVVRGETTHYELISETVTQGLMDLMIKNDKPVIMGLLATENEEQALKRANPDQLNKGKEFAQSALEILALRNN